MSPRKATATPSQPSTPRNPRNTVHSGRVTKPRSTTPNNTKKYPKLLPSPSIPPMPATSTGPGRPKGSTQNSPGKYGRCPVCLVGRRVRSRFKPHGISPHRGKFRFVCSNRSTPSSPVENPCDYSEVLEGDPASDPVGFWAGSAFASSSPAQEGEEEEGDLEVVVVGSSSPEERREGDVPTQRLGCPECMRGSLIREGREVGGWRETVLVCKEEGKKSDGCGYEMEIEREPVGGGYDEMEGYEAGGGFGVGKGRGVGGGRGRRDFGGGGGVGQGNNKGKGKATDSSSKPAKKTAAEAERERREMEEWAARERQRAWEDPRATAVYAGPVDEFRKKIVVDLTEEDDGDDDVVGQRAMGGRRAPPVPAAYMVGPHAPIVIEDDSDEFDNIASDDERALMHLADKAAVDDDMEEEEDDLEIMDMRDVVLSSKRRR
ncbi:hypothetical protein C8A05DRAFT_37908 [Staphylotrichum tortipilum]|uniref:Uncharacterized protein n=1 Tax=Staphylotrichum tortipilum TaxID=2831512 RepID=A0AAN6RQ96_9PEZI|nr:hypothetical protein C8A05DRAFT_37908 [Staphylotrichum longicolle]